MTYEYIKDSNRLKEVAGSLHNQDHIFVDTEFMRVTTFYPVLCLLQIGVEDQLYVVDPLEEIDLSPIWELFANEKIVKVFHSARQDLEIIYHHSGTLPHPVFDTQIAAMALGYKDSIGYSSLVEDITGTEVDKTQQFTNWKDRPLSDEQLHYAAMDVLHLQDIYHHIIDQLEKRGRNDWIKEELEDLVDPKNYQTDIDAVMSKISVRDRNTPTLSILRNLVTWREEQAQKQDRPRRHIMPDEILVTLAKRQPRTPEKLNKIKQIDKKRIAGNTGNTLLKLIEEGLSSEHIARMEKFLEAKDLAHKASPKMGLKFDLLKLLLRYRSQEIGVIDKLITSQNELAQFAHGKREAIGFLTGWRKEQFGDLALDLVEGRISLAINEDKLAVITA